MPIFLRRCSQPIATRLVVSAVLQFYGLFQIEAQVTARQDSALTRVIDSVAASAMKSDRVPGAVVVIVRDGAVIHSRGYGLADVQRKTPVDPNHTLFGIASVSKTFTALTALRLAQEGRLNLSADIDAGLGVWKPARRFAGPITMTHLLTHTSGFDDEELGDAAQTVADVRPLEQYLTAQMPPQILPPGRLVKYTNHGTTLAGLLIERATGAPFAQVVQNEVFSPLGMHASSFAQLLPAELEAARAIPYESPRGEFKPLPRYYAQTSPAWGMSTTGADMGRFLQAALSDSGSFLSAGPVRSAWQTAAYRLRAGMPGVTPGLFEGEVRGHRFLYHEGGMAGFTGYLFLIPDQRLGLFVAQNRRSGNLRRAIQQALVSTALVADSGVKRIPVELFAVSPAADSAAIGQAPSGTYRFNREFYQHNFLKVLPLLDAGLDVAVSNSGGRVLIDGDSVVASDSGWYRYPSSGTRIAFTKGSLDVPASLSFSTVPLAAYTRVHWYETSRFHRYVLAATTLALIGSLFTEPSGSLSGDAATARKLGVAVAGTHVAFVAAFGAAMALNVNALQYGAPGPVRVALILPVANVALTAAHAIFLTRSAIGATQGLSRSRTVRQSAITLSSAISLLSLNYWNLVGWKF